MPLTGTNVSSKIRTQYEERFVAVNLQKANKQKKRLSLIKTVPLLVKKALRHWTIPKIHTISTGKGKQIAETI